MQPEDRVCRFLNCFVPIYNCNLKCEYCYVGQGGDRIQISDNHKLDPTLIKRALTKERLGGTCLINFCGFGETLLPDEMPEVVKGLLENGHLVSVVTNNTLRERVNELCKLGEKLRERLFVKCSFHYLELLKRNKLEDYFYNINQFRKNHISYSIEMVSNDSSIEYIDEIVDIFRERGEALPHVLESRDNASKGMKRLTQLPLKQHRDTWGKFDSALFTAQQTMWGESRTEFCRAGEFSAEIDLVTGELRQCMQSKVIQSIYQDLDKPLQFLPIGKNCPMEHCYISYAWQGLCGNIRNIEYPTYEVLRNRIRPDGEEWLTPTVKELFSFKCREMHICYSEKIERMMNAVMTAWHRGLGQVSGQDAEELKAALKSWCMQQNIKSVAIYGMADIGQLFFILFNELEMSIGNLIDKRKGDLPEEKFIESDVFLRSLKLGRPVDLILVTPLVQSQKLKKQVEGSLSSNRVKTVFDLLKEMVQNVITERRN